MPRKIGRTGSRLRASWTGAVSWALRERVSREARGRGRLLRRTGTTSIRVTLTSIHQRSTSLESDLVSLRGEGAGQALVRYQEDMASALDDGWATGEPAHCHVHFPRLEGFSRRSS